MNINDGVKCSVRECADLVHSNPNHPFRRYKYCTFHRSFYLTKRRFGNPQDFDNSVCARCGWDDGPCDRHRLIPKLGYRVGNVVILCPNCHRLVSYEIITLDDNIERAKNKRKFKKYAGLLHYSKCERIEHTTEIVKTTTTEDNLFITKITEYNITIIDDKKD